MPWENAHTYWPLQSVDRDQATDSGNCPPYEPTANLSCLGGVARVGHREGPPIGSDHAEIGFPLTRIRAKEMASLVVREVLTPAGGFDSAKIGIHRSQCIGLTYRMASSKGRKHMN